MEANLYCGYNSSIPYLLKPKEYRPFNYLNLITKALIKKQPFPIKEINTSGSRGGQKTYQFTDKFALWTKISIAMKFKIAIYIARFKLGEIYEIIKTVKERLEENGFNESTSKYFFKNEMSYIQKTEGSKPIIKFSNGSFIQFFGLRKANKDMVSLKGLAACTNFEYAISFREEANEIPKADEQAIDFAIRGSKNYLKMAAANPDFQFQDYIVYVNSFLPYSKYELETYGEQFKLINDHGILKIFHHLNYMLNPYLPDDEVFKFHNTKRLDPQKYESWGIGIPGGFEKNVFSRYLAKVNNGIGFKPVEFIAGADFGLRHPTTGYIIGIDKDGNQKPLLEFFHWNDNAAFEYWDTNKLASEMVKFFINAAIKYPQLKQQYLTVKVDWGGGGKPYKDVLNDILERYYPNEYWLRFESIKKEVYSIDDRVTLTILLINAGMIYIDKELTPWLWKQMNMMVYKTEQPEPTKNKVEVLAINDDAWAAWMYAMMEKAGYLRSKIKEKNIFLLNKYE